VGHVHSIAVDPQFRKKGVGRALMEETFRMLRERGVKSVVLEVSIANEAGISFWKSLGFSPVGIRKRFYLDGTDAIIMRKEI
ncbi:MAG: GNAT family N-acetyltransferase, partial [Thermofilum sp.]